MSFKTIEIKMAAVSAKRSICVKSGKTPHRKEAIPMAIRLGFLRTVPTIAIAHTFCASQDTRFPIGNAYKHRDIFARFKTIRKK